MGAGAFRGTGDTLIKRDAEGSDEVEEEAYEEWAVSEEPAGSEELAVSEDWDIDEPLVRLISSTLSWLMKYIQRPVGMTPTFQKSAPRKHRAPEMP